MIRLFHTKIGFYRIYPSGFYVDPGFAFSQLFYLSFLVGHENTQDEKGAKNQ